MKILITGGTGLIGTEISKQLLVSRHEVVYYSRNPGKNEFGIREFAWDPDKGDIDPEGLEGVNSIINLAGAPLDKRWTPQYKSSILRSRVDSTRLLFNTVQKHRFPVKSLASASAVGYYPHDYDRLYTEEDPPGSDFLSTVTQKWEKEAQNFESLGIRTLRCRIGIVLSKDGGAFPEIARPVKFGVGAALGNGRQWLPWIHIADVAGIFIHLLENDNLQGACNVVGPTNVTNKELTARIAQAVNRSLFMPNVPAFALKLAFGEMARTVLISNKVSNQKVASGGYSYKFPELNAALRDLVS